MKRIDLFRYIPMGRERSQFITGGYIALVVAGCRSLGFIGNYLDARRALYTGWVGGSFHEARMLIPGAVIRPFSWVVQDCFRLFPVFWLFMALEVLACYACHKQDSMSIYLMRRLPDKWELHRRCWGRPLIFTGLSLLLILALTGLYFVIYLLFTPVECLPF